MTFPDLNAAPFGGEQFQTQFDCAVAVSVPEPQAATVFDYSSDGHERHSHGCGELFDAHRTVYRSTAGVFRVPA
jgi:hypothetical protein